MVSFIVPAHNEEGGIAATLLSIRRAAEALALSFELLVVNDSSTDRTEEIASHCGARVKNVDFRHISATRHAGALAAVGSRLIFVDADTLVDTAVIEGALQALERGAQGGGCLFRFDRDPIHVRLLQWVLGRLCLLSGFSAGCFLFCTREAYQACGGFDRSLFAAEEIAFALALRRRGRYVVLPRFVTTSGRKLRTHGMMDLFRLMFHLARHGPRALQSRQGLDIWYLRRAEPPPQ